MEYKEIPGKIYYSLDHKGDLLFCDILILDKKERKLIFIDDESYDNDLLPFSARKLTQRMIQGKYKTYKKKGYEITEIDGAGERLPKEEVFAALDMTYNKEKLYELTKWRPEIYPYYDLKRIRIIFRKYVHDEVSDLYMDYWINFYMRCLFECYNIRKEVLTTAFINGICAELEQLNVLLSNQMTHEEKVLLVRNVYKEIKTMDEAYHRQKKILEEKHSRKKKKTVPKEQRDK